MTTQAKDSVYYRDQECSLIGIKGTPLFVPKEHGLEPVSTNSANWRGFSCGWVVKDGFLWLDRVNTAIYQDDRNAESAPLLLGKRPETAWMVDVIEGINRDLNLNLRRPDECLLRIIYTDLQVRTHFSGGLLLGARYVANQRFGHSILLYQEVYELIFVDGQVTHEYDRTSTVEEIWRQEPELPYSEMHEQLERTLTLPYLGYY